mmetsp:Transcript_52678/g.78082  ORF Transcript_52678/g.78082 Transcript_52678/m.78082 type:complete len:200 (-) Transcript_52678:33-632(-)
MPTVSLTSLLRKPPLARRTRSRSRTSLAAFPKPTLTAWSTRLRHTRLRTRPTARRSMPRTALRTSSTACATLSTTLSSRASCPLRTRLHWRASSTTPSNGSMPTPALRSLSTSPRRLSSRARSTRSSPSSRAPPVVRLAVCPEVCQGVCPEVCLVASLEAVCPEVPAPMLALRMMDPASRKLINFLLLRHTMCRSRTIY